jgi:hypothetical protein
MHFSGLSRLPGICSSGRGLALGIPTDCKRALIVLQHGFCHCAWVLPLCVDSVTVHGYMYARCSFLKTGFMFVVREGCC